MTAAHLIGLAILCLLVPACESAAPVLETATRPAVASPSIAITNVTVINVTSGAHNAARTVLIEGDQVSAIGAAIAIPEGAVRVDGTGKFLIPGLWDMHAHHQANGVESLDLYVANGVVGTRDMGSDVDFILPLRDRISRGELQGPEIVAAGPILDDRPPDWPFRRRVTNAEEARQAVRDLKARGVDFIKVHDGTPRDALFAIADETRKVGLSFAGHVPNSVTVEEAVDAGIRSIEHLANFRVFRDCSGDEPYSAERCRPRFAALAAKGIWQTPTMAFVHGLPDLFSGKPMPHGEYASSTLLELTRKNAEASAISEERLSGLRALGKMSLLAVHDLASSGSGMLAGCDGLVPGFCLHDELELMTTAGLSPLQAIQTATLNPARFLGRANTQGTIDVGMRADLLLLDANPLTDIRHTRRISGVVARGRLLSKETIDQVLSGRRRAPALR
jgi:imidazolonepropionase-like amidohydrolase